MDVHMYMQRIVFQLCVKRMLNINNLAILSFGGKGFKVIIILNKLFYKIIFIFYSILYTQ